MQQGVDDNVERMKKEKKEKRREKRKRGEESEKKGEDAQKRERTGKEKFDCRLLDCLFFVLD